MMDENRLERIEGKIDQINIKIVISPNVKMSVGKMAVVRVSQYD